MTAWAGRYIAAVRAGLGTAGVAGAGSSTARANFGSCPGLNLRGRTAGCLISAGTAVAVGVRRGFVTGSRSCTARTGLGRGLSRTSPGITRRVAIRTRVRMGMPFTAQSGTAATVGTRFRPIGAAGLVCRWSTRLTRCALATGIGCRATVITGFIGYVAVRVARTRGADTAGVGRGTSVVTGNRRRTAIGVGLAGGTLRTAVVRSTAIGAGLVGNVTVGIGLAGSTPVTGVVSGTAIGTAHGRNRTFGADGTAVVVTAAGGSRYFIFSRTVGRIVFELGLAYTLVIFTLTGSASGCVVAGTIGRSILIFVLTTTVNVTFERRGHIVVILGTDISAVNIGRRMHSVVFLTVAVNVSATGIIRTAADVSFQIIGEPIDTGDFDAGSGSKRLRQ